MGSEAKEVNKSVIMEGMELEKQVKSVSEDSKDKVNTELIDEILTELDLLMDYGEDGIYPFCFDKHICTLSVPDMVYFIELLLNKGDEIGFKLLESSKLFKIDEREKSYRIDCGDDRIMYLFKNSYTKKIIYDYIKYIEDFIPNPKKRIYVAGIKLHIKKV